MEDDLRLDRQRVTQFERLAASHVLNAMGLELFRLHFHFALGIGHSITLTTHDWPQEVESMVARYRAKTLYPDLLEDVLLVRRAGGQPWKWSRLTDQGWSVATRPGWISADQIIFSESIADPSVSLQRPVLVFPLPASDPSQWSLVVRYRVKTVLETIVPAVVRSAFSHPGVKDSYSASVVLVDRKTLADPKVDLVTPLVPTMNFSEWSRSDVDEALNAPAPPESGFYLEEPASPLQRKSEFWALQVSLQPAGLKAYLSQVQGRNLLWAAGLLLLIGAGTAGFLYAVSRILRASERERAFSTLISHELKTPLAAVLSLSENLAGGYIQDAVKVQTYGSRIVEQTGRLGTMVESILALSRLRLTGEISRAEVFDLADLAAEAATDVGLPDPEVGPGTWMALGNRQAVGSALDNLVTNALHYGFKPGEARLVQVSLRRSRSWFHRWVGVAVTDHGNPVRGSEWKTWFKPYRRGTEASRKQISGSGIGLTLVSVTMALLGGRVRVQPVSGGGLTFTLWLREGAAS